MWSAGGFLHILSFNTGFCSFFLIESNQGMVLDCLPFYEKVVQFLADFYQFEKCVMKFLYEDGDSYNRALIKESHFDQCIMPFSHLHLKLQLRASFDKSSALAPMCNYSKTEISTKLKFWVYGRWIRDIRNILLENSSTHCTTYLTR